MKMKNITAITMMMKMITMMMTTMTTEEYYNDNDVNDDDARMPRDLVTDPGERRDWLEKCRINKLKVGIVIVVVYDHA